MNWKKNLIRVISWRFFDRARRKRYRKLAEIKYGVFNPSEQYHLNFAASARVKCEGLEAAAADIKTLIIGDSHAAAGVLPFMFGENAYNFAINANGLYETLFTLKYAAERCPNLKKVILEASYFSGSHSKVHTRLLWECCVLEKELGIHYDYAQNKVADPVVERAVAETVMAKERLRGGVYCHCQGYVFARNGCAPEPGVERRVQKRHSLWQRFDNQWQYLEEICEFCRSRDISLTVISAPFRSDYCRMVAVLNQGKEVDMEARIKDITARYGVPYFQFFEGFDDSEFNDGDHLNTAGAVKLTRMLLRVMAAPVDKRGKGADNL